MFGGFGVSQHKAFPITGLTDSNILPIVIALAMAFALPNTQEFMRDYDPAYEKVDEPSGRIKKLRWSPQAYWLWIPISVLFALALTGLSPHRVSEFLYFQF